jgi:hypothetical protein
MIKIFKMISKRTQTTLFGISLALGILVSIRQLIVTNRNEKANTTRIAVLEEQVAELKA